MPHAAGSISKCILKNSDFKGLKDIEGRAAQKATSEECASHCVNTPGCTVAVHNGKTCYPESVGKSEKPETRNGFDVIVPQGSDYPCTHSPMLCLPFRCKSPLLWPAQHSPALRYQCRLCWAQNGFIDAQARLIMTCCALAIAF